MPVELLVGYFRELVEVEGEFYAGLRVRFCVVAELGIGELVVDLFERHFVW